MKICLQDRGFHCIVLGRVLSRSGHDVYFTSNHKLSEAYGTSIGYDERFQNVLDRDWDLVIDCTGNFSFEGYVDALRNRGVPCIGGGLFGARA